MHNVNSPFNTTVSVLAVKIDASTMGPYCNVSKEKLAERKAAGKYIFEGWDPRHLRLSYLTSNKPYSENPIFGYPAKDKKYYSVSAGIDENNFETYEMPISESIRNIGYDRLYIAPKGVIGTGPKIIVCKIVGEGRKNVGDWAGRPNICYFDATYKGARIKIGFHADEMKNLPEVWKKTKQFTDVHAVESPLEAIWHFLTS